MDDGSRLPRRGPAKVIDWIQGLFFRVFHFFKGEQEDSVTEKEIISMVAVSYTHLTLPTILRV